MKSTVPIGNNDRMEKHIKSRLKKGIEIGVVSNPEFLSQGTAIRNALDVSRI